MNDPCENSVLNATISTIYLYGIIGNPQRQFIFPDYIDTVSLKQDGEESSDQGYVFCGERNHFMYEHADSEE